MSSNGSNARLDRIEKLIEESERANKEAHARHDRQIAEIRIEFNREIAESRAEFKHEMAEHRRQMNADLRKTRDDMRRWAALGVREARNQRKQRLKLDADIGLLVSSQLETKAMLKELISSLKTGQPRWAEGS
jgi:hypothetical protein